MTIFLRSHPKMLVSYFVSVYPVGQLRETVLKYVLVRMILNQNHPHFHKLSLTVGATSHFLCHFIRFFLSILDFEP